MSLEPTNPILINSAERIEETLTTTQSYFANHPVKLQSLATIMWAYHEIGDLYPQTLVNAFSGHYFPYTESYYELENSYQLALRGFYSYSFYALRSALELGLLGPYFAVEDNEHIEVRPWITSANRTPSLKKILNKLKKINALQVFDQQFKLIRRIQRTYDELSGFVHTRGYKNSSMGQNRANFSQFSEDALNLYSTLMENVVTNLIISVLLKYLIGMQGLPMSEKFGIAGPAGGFLEPHQVALITSVIDDEEKAFIQELSNNNQEVQAIVKQIEDMPDLTEEQWEQQVKESDELLASFKKKDS